MRLLPLKENEFEVQEHNWPIGRVWLYKGQWRAELSDGTPVKTDEFFTANAAGNAVAQAHRRRG